MKKKISKSTKIFWILVFILAVFSALNIYLPQGEYVSLTQLPASKPLMALAIFALIFIIYGAVGYLGLLLARKLNFADIWDEKITNKQRFLTPLIIGAVLGVGLIIGDIIFSRFNGLGKFIHPPFPTSIIASLNAGIGEELMFRLFFISFWVFLISLVFKGKYKNQIFWVVSVTSALAFALAHIPTVMAIYSLASVSQIPPVFISEIIILNGTISMFCAYYFRKYGYLAAVGIHFWTDIVWHVFYGLI